MGFYKRDKDGYFEIDPGNCVSMPDRILYNIMLSLGNQKTGKTEQIPGKPEKKEAEKPFDDVPCDHKCDHVCKICDIAFPSQIALMNHCKTKGHKEKKDELERAKTRLP